MEGTKEIDELMQPLMAALNRRGIKGDARTDIYNRAYEAAMISMDAKTALEHTIATIRATIQGWSGDPATLRGLLGEIADLVGAELPEEDDDEREHPA
jgi:hypothetical protein